MDHTGVRLTGVRAVGGSDLSHEPSKSTLGSRTNSYAVAVNRAQPAAGKNIDPEALDELPDQRSGLIGLVWGSPSTFYPFVAFVLIIAIIMFALGAVCAADVNKTHPCGGAGLGVGLPLIVFGIAFFVQTLVSIYQWRNEQF
eukprot:m.35431 g.35431  ORF g.35431 m.35431 type:complete len:142 (+) comp10925_c0_seq1:183-608(+)